MKSCELAKGWISKRVGFSTGRTCYQQKYLKYPVFLNTHILSEKNFGWFVSLFLSSVEENRLCLCCLGQFVPTSHIGKSKETRACCFKWCYSFVNTNTRRESWTWKKVPDINLIYNPQTAATLNSLGQTGMAQFTFLGLFAVSDLKPALNCQWLMCM